MKNLQKLSQKLENHIFYPVLSMKGQRWERWWTRMIRISHFKNRWQYQDKLNEFGFKFNKN